MVQTTPAHWRGPTQRVRRIGYVRIATRATFAQLRKRRPAAWIRRESCLEVGAVQRRHVHAGDRRLSQEGGSGLPAQVPVIGHPLTGGPRRSAQASDRGTLGLRLGTPIPCMQRTVIPRYGSASRLHLKAGARRACRRWTTCGRASGQIPAFPVRLEMGRAPD